MKPFLKRLAEEIASRYGNDPGQLCVVLPNRRAGLYLKKYLAKELNHTAWSPQTFSVEDFITSITGLQLIDTTGLLFEFYYVHKELHGADAQDFEVFSDWGQVLLQDFEEIDQYLVDPDKIFTFLSEARAISVWNLGESPLTDHEKSYLEFYQSFLDYYKGLRNRLTAKKLAYQGLAYRIAAENIRELALKFPYRKIFFAGLNALSGAEEEIVSFLLHEDMAEIFWDADEYYIKDKGQEAGEFIRAYLGKWPANPVKWIENDFRLMKKEISVYGIPRSMGQAIKAGQIVNMLKTEEEAPDRVALVLADEKLLLPVLYSLPGELSPVNVTMGFPFKYTHLYHLAGLLFQMQDNARKFAEQKKSGSKSFYVKDILKILAHPYILMFDRTGRSKELSIENLSESIRLKNRVFLSKGELMKLSGNIESDLNKLLDRVFSPWDSPMPALDGTLGIIEMIRDKMFEDRQDQQVVQQVDLEYLFHFSKIIKQCRTMMETYPFIQNLNTLRKILFQLLDSFKLPFTGEPLQGLQVMGVLETRAIDFENLVVLSVNEGILPAGRTPNSFIPFDIKTEFGLPTFRQKDAVFAYHFYRMIQRARRVFLLYDTEGDRMKGGEKSRFVTQLGYELKKYNPDTIFEERLLGPRSPSAVEDRGIVMVKTPAIMARLLEKANTGFSPSSLNLFIRCPLQFYFQEMLGLSEAETIEETIEAKTMGTVIHTVFQHVFQPFEGKFVDPAALLANIKQAETYLRDAFTKEYPGGDLEHGKNHLIFKASLFLINQFIKQEADDLLSSMNPSSSLKIIMLEQNFYSQLPCLVSGKEISVNIKGKTDRIDVLNGVTRIIDYKTGLVNPAELNLKAWEKLTSDPKMAKAFQLIVYAWLFYRNQDNTDQAIETGNITLRKISQGFMKVKLPDDRVIGEETMEIFGELLKELLEKIMDPEIPFTQAEDAENCTYCPFTAICTR